MATLEERVLQLATIYFDEDFRGGVEGKFLAIDRINEMSNMELLTIISRALENAGVDL